MYEVLRMAEPIFTAVTALSLPLAWFPSTGEWIIIVAFGLLLFGKRLPEVGRSLGKGIVEFKKGLKGVEDEVDTASEAKPVEHKYDPHTVPPKLPEGAKFDPYTGKPLEQAQAAGGTVVEPGKAG
jgi:sec-independent protein translocase protein TatA